MKFCATYSSTTAGLCDKCMESHIKTINNTCAPKTINCENYDKFGVCTDCKDTHKLENTICHKIIPNCDSYSTDPIHTDKCDSCEEN